MTPTATATAPATPMLEMVEFIKLLLMKEAIDKRLAELSARFAQDSAP